MMQVAQNDAPVTTILELKPRGPARQEAIKSIQAIIQTASRCEGYLSADIFEKVNDGPPAVIAIMLRFDTYTHLEAWNESTQKRQQVLSSKHLFKEVAREVRLTGLEFWFDSRQQRHPAQPVKWKMLIVTVAIIFILLNTLMPFIGNLLTPLGLPVWGNSLIGIIIMVALMTYLIMPATTRALHTWLFKKK
jgi:hypothetical protein